MKSICLVSLILIGLTTSSLHSAEGKGKGKKPDKSPATQAEPKPAEKKKEPLAGVTITATEREIIQTYVKTYAEPAKPGKPPKKLPPGLEKKVARGGSLPPGWEKKLVKSEIMPVEVYQECHPLPPEVVIKLPPPPVGVITVTVSGKVVRLLEATREILDVFEVSW
jgi:hypothetical protein